MITTLSLIVCALLAATGLAQRLVYAYAGLANDTSPAAKIFLYPDILFNEILISSNDFNCTDKTGCSMTNVPREMTFLNKTFQYYDAEAQVNLIKQPFDERVRFRYVFNDTQNVTSILGLAQNSTFLNYYSRQNRKNDFSLIFRMDYENMITFKDSVVEKFGLHPFYALNAKIAYNMTDPRWNKNATLTAGLPSVAKVCFSNRVDMSTASSSVMAVKESVFGTWAAMVNDINANLTDATNTLANNITFNLYDPQAQYVGQMVYYMDEFVNANKTLLIKPFTPQFDEGRMCDIYTGINMLKKYNVRYYYIENPTGYQTQFTYDLNNMVGTNDVSSSSGFWWKLLLFLVIVGIIGYFAYKYFMTSRETHNDGDDDTYRNFPPNQDLMEMKEMTRAETVPKRPVPAPADDTEKIPPLLGKSY